MSLKNTTPPPVDERNSPPFWGFFSFFIYKHRKVAIMCAKTIENFSTLLKSWQFQIQPLSYYLKVRWNGIMVRWLWMKLDKLNPPVKIVYCSQNIFSRHCGLKFEFNRSKYPFQRENFIFQSILILPQPFCDGRFETVSNSSAIFCKLPLQRHICYVHTSLSPFSLTLVEDWCQRRRCKLK